MKFALRDAIMTLSRDDYSTRRHRKQVLNNIRKVRGVCSPEQALTWAQEKFDTLTPENCDGWLDPYGFYDKDELFRQNMIGRSFSHRDGRCYVIGLSNPHTNYGVAQGLLYLCGVYKDWFKLGAISPDDLDLDLNFEGHPHLWPEVATYMEQHETWYDTSYLAVLEQVQDAFPVGTLYH